MADSDAVEAFKQAQASAQAAIASFGKSRKGSFANNAQIDGSEALASAILDLSRGLEALAMRLK